MRHRVAIALVALVAAAARPVGRTPIVAAQAAAQPRGTAALAAPASTTFHGCPPEGAGKDPLLDGLKNRVDEGPYTPMEFDTIINLPWPPGVGGRVRDRWKTRDRHAVERYEGRPVAVEGFIGGLKREKPEATNCYQISESMRDYHIALVPVANDSAPDAIVAEVTPRVRANHPAWRFDRLEQLQAARQRIRVSGWLMLDQAHPDQLGVRRATLWEVHPVMRVELRARDGRWIALDSLPPRP
jgi:hypothetical protein